MEATLSSETSVLVIQRHIPEDGHRRENLKYYIALPAGLCSGNVMSPVRYELRFYIPEDGILHSHRRENLKCYVERDPVPELVSFELFGIPDHRQILETQRLQKCFQLALTEVSIIGIQVWNATLEKIIRNDTRVGKYRETLLLHVLPNIHVISPGIPFKESDAKPTELPAHVWV
jgi:hypothetical protein